MTTDHAHRISPDQLTLEHIGEIIARDLPLALSDEARRRIQHCREHLDQKIAHPDTLYYGINTGFGSLCNVRIADEDIEQLQHNLVVSHAAGTGDLVPPEIVRLMLLLKIQSLSYGHSAVRVEVVERLVDFYNANACPVVFELGSLGASGDLAPLAHLSLPLIGLGEIWHNGRRQRADVFLKTMGWEPLRFKAKEALALLNGTQFSTAYAVHNLLKARRLAEQADLNAALGVDAFNGRISPFDPRIQQIRPHAGQALVAENVRRWLAGSEILASEKTAVQDPYAFRCVPQVHGASRDALAHVERTISTEMNSTTDNPLVFPADGDILSGGNFHAQPVALAMDFFAIATSELGSISERRLYQLISGQRGLPAFLTENPGLHSGLMIAQYTAAAIASQNKQLCTPASVDSIVSCNGQEDHVSMAANAATKARRVADNVERLLAVEFMAGMQALEFRRPLRSSEAIENLRKNYRAVVPALEGDRVIADDIELTIRFLQENSNQIGLLDG